MKFSFNISLPTDDDNYVLLECSSCEHSFRVASDDLEEIELSQLYCPYSGSREESYYPHEVREYAVALARAEMAREINETFADLESLNGSGVRFNVSEIDVESPPPLHISERPGPFKIVKHSCASFKVLNGFKHIHCVLCGQGL